MVSTPKCGTKMGAMKALSSSSIFRRKLSSSMIGPSFDSRDFGGDGVSAMNNNSTSSIYQGLTSANFLGSKRKVHIKLAYLTLLHIFHTNYREGKIINSYIFEYATQICICILALIFNTNFWHSRDRYH